MKLLHHSYSTNGDRPSGAHARIVTEDELFELLTTARYCGNMLS